MLYILTAEEMNALVPREELLKMAERADKAELRLESLTESLEVLAREPKEAYLNRYHRLVQEKFAAYEGKDGTTQ
jgi:hypothetical protein